MYDWLNYNLISLINYLYKWQATKCPGSTSFNSGLISEHTFIASLHLPVNLQPGGGSSGDGISPSKTILLVAFATLGSGIGTAYKSALV